MIHKRKLKTAKKKIYVLSVFQRIVTVKRKSGEMQCLMHIKLRKITLLSVKHIGPDGFGNPTSNGKEQIRISTIHLV